MRKLLVTLVAALVAMAACAESRWGVTAGANYNDMHFKQSDIFESGHMVGGEVGVMGELIAPGIGFGIDGAVLYSMRGGKLHLGDKRAWAAQGVGTENAILHYIDVPIALKLKYHNLGGFENTLMPIIFAGPTISFLAGHSNCADQLSYKTVSASLNMGLGVEIKNRVQVKAGYQFGLGESVRTKLLDEHIAKNRTWFLTATYFIK